MTKAKLAITFKLSWWFRHVTLPFAAFRARLGLPVDVEALTKRGIDTAKMELCINTNVNEENK